MQRWQKKKEKRFSIKINSKNKSFAVQRHHQREVKYKTLNVTHNHNIIFLAYSAYERRTIYLEKGFARRVPTRGEELLVLYLLKKSEWVVSSTMFA